MLRIDKVLSVAFIAGLPVAFLLAVPFVLPDTDDLNRAPVSLPEVTPAAFASAETYHDIGLWLRDRMPLRAKLRKFDAKVNRGLFHDVDDAAIVDGRDGWLFFDPALYNALQPGFDPAEIRSGIARLEHAVTSAGKTFRFAIAPHKPTIYPQYLRDRDQVRQTHARARLEEFRDLMRREPVPGYLDVWDQMEAAATASKSPIYMPRDTHWGPQGAVVMAKTLVDSLSPRLFGSARTGSGGSYTYTPDLVKYSGLNETETWQRFRVKRSGVKTTLAEKYDEPRMRSEWWKAASGKKELLPKIAIIHDSYGHALRPMLPQFFSEARFVNVTALETDFARRALADADIVFFLMVERFLYQISDETPFGPYSAGVLDAMAQSFPSESQLGGLPSGGS